MLFHHFERFLEEYESRFEKEYGFLRPIVKEVVALPHLEFLARTTSNIPDKGQVMIRYFGLYANAHRGKVRKVKEGQRFILIEEGWRIPRRV